MVQGGEPVPRSIQERVGRTHGGTLRVSPEHWFEAPGAPGRPDDGRVRAHPRRDRDLRDRSRSSSSAAKIKRPLPAPAAPSQNAPSRSTPRSTPAAAITIATGLRSCGPVRCLGGRRATSSASRRPESFCTRGLARTRPTGSTSAPGRQALSVGLPRGGKETGAPPQGAFPLSGREETPSMTALVVYLQNTVYRLKEHQEGQTMAEYALILGRIAIFVIARRLLPRREDQRPLPRDRQLGDEPGLVAPFELAAADRALRGSTGRRDSFSNG